MPASVSARKASVAFVLAVVFGLTAGLLVSTGSVEAATPPGGTVSADRITTRELLRGDVPTGLTRNDRFAPTAKASPAHHPFAGTLHLDGATMAVLSDGPDGAISNPVLGKDTTFFPDVSLSFFTVDGRLVPTTQDVIRNGVLPDTKSFWDIIVQPGRVWSERADGAWSRASFPFALVNSIEGETHTGIALFLYRGDRVSPIRFQIVQMTSPFYVPEYFTAWGVTTTGFTRGGIDDLAGRIAAHRSDVATRLPVGPWSELESMASTEALADFVSHPDVAQAAAVVDGTIYRTDCPTAAGPFPYCDDVRYGVWSVTKSSMLNVALLRLAQKYGTGFLDETIATYLPEAATDGWDDVTFFDMAMMASGHGPAGDPTCYLCDYDRWYVALSEAEKTAEALDYPGPFVEPGTLFNYRDQDAYLLGAAADALVKTMEGPDASVWDVLRHEVYAPLGIFHAPTNATVETDGSEGQPLMAYGHYATLDDLAKLALLYQQGGVWDGVQLLEPSLVAAFAPSASPPTGGFDAGGDAQTYYYFDWWFEKLVSTDGCTRYLPEMSGWGGITVTLLPADAVLIRVRNSWIGTPNPQVSINALADSLTAMCS